MDFIVIRTDITLIELKPSKGMKLTNGTDIAENEIYIGVGDSADNWYEITEAEYEKIQEERRKADEFR